MGKIIASLYEIEEEIGSGGGGVVYRGRHLRLNKQIALKAYKRTKASGTQSMKQEVEMLKDLSHTYIPQVYDYVEEGGQVYSVMEYIEGRSLDHILEQNGRVPQSQVIAWARQLLEALCYLHSRPPHGILHSDIKPANIMLTPQGDIRLIDFNIALALGEEGAVRVGLSRGYASPEHYGIDYTAACASAAETVLLPETQISAGTAARTRLPAAPGTPPGSSGISGGAVLLDVRSDVYSLGATLYHLLTGRRPAQDAREVQSITAGNGVSSAVAEIIRKAMAPDPDARYQTAAEMLCDFEHLHENDPRTKRHRRRVRRTAAALAAVFLLGGASTFLGLRQMERVQQQARVIAEAAEAALSAAADSEAALRRGDVPRAVASAMEALSIESPYAPRAQLALTEALGVYDLADGFRDHRLIPLPSEPLKLALSPSGGRTAVMVLGRALVFDTDTGEELAALPAEPSALADLVFSGENILLYAGEGGVRAYGLSENRELWSGGPATALSLSADGTALAALYKDETTAAVYDTATGEKLRTVSFGQRRQGGAFNDILADPEDNLFALSGNGRYLAVNFSDGSLSVFDLQNGDEMALLEDTDYIRFEGGFYGQYFAFSASRAGESIFAAVDMETFTQTVGFISPNIFHVWTDENGVYVSTENILVNIDPATGEQTELAYTEGDIAACALDDAHTLVLLDGGRTAFFDRDARLVESRNPGRCDFVRLAGGFAAAASLDAPSVRIMRLENHPDAQCFTYDSDYIHDEARVGKDGTVMLFRHDGFRLYAPNGALIAEEAIPEAGRVYDQQYRREEGYLEVIYYDGTVRLWSAAGGALLSETVSAPPDRSLYEEFFAGGLRIAAPLHGRPAAYDRESGELVRELEAEDYLAYVTEVGEYIVTEYITAQGERYGLLLNGQCETLARLPRLCDILEDGTLVFDDMRGNLRQSRIYSPRELTALAEIYLKEEKK